MSKTKSRILFVCTGNTCRSPMAEALMTAYLNDSDNYEVKSAGISASPGSPASGETRNILLSHHIDSQSFRSQQLDESLIEHSDYVFCMSRMHREAILSHKPEYREKALLVGEFLGEESPVDVFDPFGMGESAYKEVEKQLLVAVQNIAKFIAENKHIEKDLG